MKTQISNLINGVKYIRRDLSHTKYVNATKATSHIGYAGSNRKIRQAIADAVIAENINGLDVDIFGKKFHLNRYSSLSGKTVCYSTDISFDVFKLLSGYTEKPYEHENHFTLMFNNDMTVDIQMFSRRSELAEWKHRGNFSIDESFVTIL